MEAEMFHWMKLQIIKLKMDKRYLIGVFDDDHSLLGAIKAIRERSISIHDVLTPFAVHGMDDAMGWKRTRITVAGFISGSLGAMIALGFMWWVFNVDWPINYGGKANFPLLALIPITFEATVLSAAIGMIISFMVSCKLAPGIKKDVLDLRATDDKFLIVFDISEGNMDIDSIKEVLNSHGAVEINEKEIEKVPKC